LQEGHCRGGGWGKLGDPRFPDRTSSGEIPPCDAEYKVNETTVVLYDVPYRAVVVNSSSHDIRRQKKLEKQIASSADTITKKLKPFQ